MVKITFKDFLPWNQWYNFNETWHVESGTTAHHNLLILKLRLFLKKNVTVMDSSESIRAFDLEIG